MISVARERPQRRVVLAATILTIFVTAGCGGSSPPAAAGNAHEASTTTPSNTSASPAIASVPRPDNGTPSATNRSDSWAIHYPMPYADLAAWYDAHVPIGANLQGWRWCSSTSQATPDGGYWRSYLSDDNTSLVIATSSEPSGGSSVLIATQEDDGGDC